MTGCFWILLMIMARGCMGRLLVWLVIIAVLAWLIGLTP